MKFQLFGSATSQDYDIMVFVDTIPTVKEASILCEMYGNDIAVILKDANFPEKTVNANLAILKDGIITGVHKGTADEVNNSMLLTYDFHKQFFPNQIVRMVERDVDLKIIRCARIILSFISRTQYREIVKKALQGDFNAKLEALEQIDFSKITDLGTKGPIREDVFKTIGFQLGQTLGLFIGSELYSKESICQTYCELKPFIMREAEIDMAIINKYKDLFISQSRRKNVKILIEPRR